MVRIAVYRGREKDKSTGLTLFSFDVLNELEDTDNYLKSFQLWGRFNEWNEYLMEGRIYYVNIIPGEVNKPIEKFEILDKAKFISHDAEKGYLMTYKRYSDKHLIDTYEAEEKRISEEIKAGVEEPSTNELRLFITQCSTMKKGEKLYFNTFTKYILNKIFELYGYDSIVRYKTKIELDTWKKKITQKVKNFVASQEIKFTNWGNDEIKYVFDNMDNKSEKMIAKHLKRTVPSIATMKWKLRHKRITLDNVKPKKESININNNDMVKTRLEMIGNVIKQFRKEKGYNQKDLKEASGVSVSVISQLECGKYISTETTIVDKLLEYIDKNSKLVDISKIPTTDTVIQPKKDTKPKEEPIKGETTVEAIRKHKADVSEPIDDVVNEDSMFTFVELLSELKFLSGRTLQMENKMNKFISTLTSSDKKEFRTTIKQINKNRELVV